jgi:hypothetical protein
VTITNTGTAATKEAISSGLGQFSFSFLPPGSYSIRAQKEGFKVYQQGGITANAGQRASISVRLQEGAATQAVTVTSTPPLLATSPQQNQIHSTVEVNQLLLLKRDYTSLLSIANGVSIKGNSGTISTAAGKFPKTATNGPLLPSRPITTKGHGKCTLAAMRGPLITKDKYWGWFPCIKTFRILTIRVPVIFGQTLKNRGPLYVIMESSSSRIGVETEQKPFRPRPAFRSPAEAAKKSSFARARAFLQM